MTSRSTHPSSAERPVLRLGLAGFNNAEQSLLNVALAARAAKYQMNWQLSSLGDADAWCVNGSRVQGLPDGTLRITPGLPSGRSIRINPAEIDWPVAFSTPLNVPGFKAAYLFQPQSPESVASVLTQLEGWLRPLMVQFHLASYIVEKNLDLRSAVYHVTVNGKLYALVSRRTGIGVWPIADPGEMHNAVWSHRPGMADTVPSHYIRTDFSQLMWQYATRTARDCLPPHYRTRRLFLRRAPRLPMRLLNDPSLMLVSELGTNPGTLKELSQRTGIDEPHLARHLAALYMVGSITADPKRAPAPRSAVDTSEWTSAFDSTDLSSPAGNDLTVKLTLANVRPPPV
ncbi:MAG TPA: hypothetical protein VKP68_18160 [Ramlibacter sp.]|nr:hypothetical protein [Ramlibacter sp.]